MKIGLAIILSMGLFLSISSGATKHLEKIDKSIPLRAKIITDDNVTVAYSHEMSKLIFLNKFTKDEFSALIDKLSPVLHINKKEKIQKYFSESYKHLNYQIISYGVTKEKKRKIKKIIDTFIQDNGLNLKKKYYQFELSGERRVYPYNNFLTPVIGYCHKLENKGLTYTKGVKGLENYYDSKLTSLNNKPRDVYLNIDFDLQQKLEDSLFFNKVDIDADEIISIIMDPKTFNIKAFASSNRFNPKKITRYDFNSLNISAVETLFDIGDYLEPIKNAINNEKDLKLEDGFKKFGLYDKSGIDLNYEKVTKDTLKVNLVQLLKMYAVFYADGKIAIPSIVKGQSPKLFKQVISRENANMMKDKWQTIIKGLDLANISIQDSNRSEFVHLMERKIDSKEYLQITLTINPKNDFYSDEVERVNMPHDFPYKVIKTYTQGASNISHRYIIYSKNSNNIKIGEVTQPINKWQANKGKGSERDVQGFYQDKQGNYYIDRITTKGTKLAPCNACQTANVETLQVTKNRLISVYLRKFDLKTYKPYTKK